MRSRDLIALLCTVYDFGNLCCTIINSDNNTFSKDRQWIENNQREVTKTHYWWKHETCNGSQKLKVMQ